MINLEAIKKRFQTYGARTADTAALIAEVELLHLENRKLRAVLGWVETQCPSKCAGVCYEALCADKSGTKND